MAEYRNRLYDQGKVDRMRRQTKWHENMNEGGKAAIAANSFNRTMLPRQLNLERTYGKAFAQTDVQAGEARRKAEMGTVNRLYPEYRETLMRNSPELEAATGEFNRQISEVGSSEIEDELNRQALHELHLGGQLTQQEIDDVAQSSRSAWSQRGLVNSSPSAAGEVLDRIAFQNARKNERRVFAQSVDGMTNARQGQDRQFITGSMGTASALFDPFNRLFPQGSQAEGLDLDRLSTMSDIGNRSMDRELSKKLAYAEMAQRDRMHADGLEWDQEQFAINRLDSNRNSDRNSQAAQDASSSGQTSAYVSAGASIASAALLALAF